MYQGSSNCLIRRTSMALKGKGHPTSCDLIRRDETIFRSAPRPENPKLEISLTLKAQREREREREKERMRAQISLRIARARIPYAIFFRATWLTRPPFFSYSSSSFFFSCRRVPFLQARTIKSGNICRATFPTR